MARKENLVDGHGNGPPCVTAAAKAVHDLLVAGTLRFPRRDQTRDRFAMPCNHYGLATLDGPEEFRQARLGFGSLYGAHDPF